MSGVQMPLAQVTSTTVSFSGWNGSQRKSMHADSARTPPRFGQSHSLWVVVWLDPCNRQGQPHSLWGVVWLDSRLGQSKTHSLWAVVWLGPRDPQKQTHSVLGACAGRILVFPRIRPTACWGVVWLDLRFPQSQPHSVLGCGLAGSANWDSACV